MPNALQTELTRKPTPEPVEDTARWPEWAEEARLDDELTAKAYEATPPSCRAAAAYSGVKARTAQGAGNEALCRQKPRWPSRRSSRRQP